MCVIFQTNGNAIKQYGSTPGQVLSIIENGRNSVHVIDRNGKRNVYAVHKSAIENEEIDADDKLFFTSPIIETHYAWQPYL